MVERQPEALVSVVFRASHRDKHPTAALALDRLRRTPRRTAALVLDRLPPDMREDLRPGRACLGRVSGPWETPLPDPLGLAELSGALLPNPLPCPRLLLTARSGSLLPKGSRGRLQPARVRHRPPITGFLRMSTLRGRRGWEPRAYPVSVSGLLGTLQEECLGLADRRALPRASSPWIILSPLRRLHLRPRPKLRRRQAQHSATSSATLYTVPDPSLM